MQRRGSLDSLLWTEVCFAAHLRGKLAELGTDANTSMAQVVAAACSSFHGCMLNTVGKCAWGAGEGAQR